METVFRPLTIDELYFDQPIVMNVPYSLAKENLPDISIAQVTAPPIPDLSENQFHRSSFLTKTGKFIAKNRWLFIGLAVAVAGGIYYVHKKNIKARDKK